MPGRLSVSLAGFSQFRSPCPSVKADRARRLDHHHEALLDLLVQRPQRGLGALDLARQAELLVARAAHEDDHAVAGDAVLLGLERIDVEVVVGDLELARLLRQILHVVVDLFADLAPLGEEHGDLDRLVEVADDPARHLARAGGAEVGQVDLLVALRGDVGDA